MINEAINEILDYVPGARIVNEFLNGKLVKKCQLDLGVSNPFCIFLSMFEKINSSITHSVYASPLFMYIALCLYPFKHLRYLK